MVRARTPSSVRFDDSRRCVGSRAVRCVSATYRVSTRSTRRFRNIMNASSAVRVTSRITPRNCHSVSCPAK